MAPPPRPPVICYDIQPNVNPRPPIVQVPRAGHRRKTVISVRPPEPSRPAQDTKQFNRHIARFAYHDKLRNHVQEREREREKLRETKKNRLLLQAQLDNVTAQLDVARKAHGDIIKTFGMGHSTAKYIERQEEETDNMRKKMIEITNNRSRESSRRVKQLEKLLEFQRGADKKILSPQPDSSMSSLSSVSSVSSQSFSTSSSSPPASLVTSSPKRPTDETIEISDMDFFEAVEDKTMIEVDALIGETRRLLNEINAITQ